MDAAVVVALIGVALLVGELLLSTGGVLAALGTAGLIVGGVLALESNSGAADYVGPALIVLGIISAVAFYMITRKVIEAHRDQPVQTGSEELVGSLAEARTNLNPEGQVWVAGALWRARTRADTAAVRLGDRVRVDAVEGLTLLVSPEPIASTRQVTPNANPEEGTS